MNPLKSSGRATHSAAFDLLVFDEIGFSENCRALTATLAHGEQLDSHWLPRSFQLRCTAHVWRKLLRAQRYHSIASRRWLPGPHYPHQRWPRTMNWTYKASGRVVKVNFSLTVIRPNASDGCNLTHRSSFNGRKRRVVHSRIGCSDFKYSKNILGFLGFF